MDGRAKKGKSFPRQIPQETWNDALDAGKIYGEQKILGPGDRPPLPIPVCTDTVKLKNLSGANLPRGRVLEVGTNILTTLDPQHLWFEGNTPVPDDCKAIAILRRPQPIDAIDECQVSGVCLAVLNVTDIDHCYADVNASTILQSMEHGRVRILWTATGGPSGGETGEQDAVIVFESSACCEGQQPTDPNPCLDPCPCCDPDEVSQFKFILGNVTGDSACCALLEAEYTLDRDTEVGGCRWVYCEENFCEEDAVQLDLKIIATFFSEDQRDKCNCTVLNIEVSLVEHNSGKTRLYMQFIKEIEQTEDCCLISETMNLVCYRTDLCDAEAEEQPTGKLCAICSPLACEGCAGTEKRYINLAVSGIDVGDCELAELLNRVHVLFQVEGDPGECTWTEVERRIGECLAQFRLVATLGGIGVEWELTLTTTHEEDAPEVVTWTGESLNCDVTDLELTTAETPDDVDITGATVEITASEDACEADVCCDQGDQLPLRMTLFADCDEDLDGEFHEMEPDPDIAIHHRWEVTEDWFVCNGGLLNFRARLNCTDGNYRLTFFGTGTSSGCTKDAVTLTPTDVQCEPFEITFETVVSNTGTPVDCDCCDEGLPFTVTIVITLGDAPAAAVEYGDKVKAVVTEPLGIAGGASGTVEIWYAGAATGDSVTAHANWMFGSNSAALGAEVLIKWYADENKWVIEELEC